MPYSCRQTYLLHTSHSHTFYEKFSLGFHPSVLTTCFFFQCPRATGTYLQKSLCKRWSTPWTGHRSISGSHRDKCDRQPFTVSLTPRNNLELAMNLTCTFLFCGKKPENLEKLRLCMRREYKLHPEKPHTVSLRSNSSNHYATVLPHFTNILHLKSFGDEFKQAISPVAIFPPKPCLCCGCG